MCDNHSTVASGAASTDELRSAGGSRLERCRAALWNEQARSLVVAERRPRQILDALVEADHLADAIRFLAMVLPKRSSVWWGALCTWSAYRESAPDDDRAALEATLRWLHSPAEIHRRSAEAAGRKASVRTPAGALAMAAFMSGGSISRPQLPPVAPPAHATGRLVAGAVLLAAVRCRPLEYRNHYRQYLAVGLDVADGHLEWPAAALQHEAEYRVDAPQSSPPAPNFSLGRRRQPASESILPVNAGGHAAATPRTRNTSNR